MLENMQFFCFSLVIRGNPDKFSNLIQNVMRSTCGFADTNSPLIYDDEKLVKNLLR